MNLKVCVVTVIFLSLENVAGLICLPSFREAPRHQQWPLTTPSPPEIPRQQQQGPSIKKPEIKHYLEGTQAFTCFSPKLYHQWYQGYQGGRRQIVIGNIPPQEGVKTTRYIIKVEEFDNNTVIYCKNSPKDTLEEENSLDWRDPHVTNFIATANSYLKPDSDIHVYSEFYKTLIKTEASETRKANEDLIILKYNEKQNVSFSCLEHINKTTYIQLGLINTTSNMIKTFEAGSTHEILNITHNGTILCCVYYVVNKTAEENWITRFVTNKTLLLYNDIIQHVYQRDEEGLKVGANLAAVHQGHQTIIIISITAVAIVFILLAITVICKKRCRKKPESEAKVLYADLDILRQVEPDNLPRTGPEQECPYAQIIGEMRPQTK